MSQRNCIYTGLPAKRTDKVIPKEGGDESHNWGNSVPCSEEYKNIKNGRQPNRLELEARDLFFEMEGLRLRLQVLETRQKDLQRRIRRENNLEPIEEQLKIEEKSTKPKKINKEEQIKQAYKEKEIIDMADKLDEILEQKKNKKIFF